MAEVLQLNYSPFVVVESLVVVKTVVGVCIRVRYVCGEHKLRALAR